MKKLIIFAALAALAFGFEFNLDSKAGALEGVKELGTPSTEVSLSLQNDAPITGADYDADKKQFALVSKNNEFYVADENLKQIGRAHV